MSKWSWKYMYQLTDPTTLPVFWSVRLCFRTRNSFLGRGIIHLLHQAIAVPLPFRTGRTTVFQPYIELIHIPSNGATEPYGSGHKALPGHFADRAFTTSEHLCYLCHGQHPRGAGCGCVLGSGTRLLNLANDLSDNHNLLGEL